MSGTVRVGRVATAEVDDGCSPSDERVAANQGAQLRWRPQLTQESSEHIGLNGIDRYHDFLNMIALDALKCAYIELQASRHNARKHHRAPALRTFQTFDCDCWNAGVP